MLASSPPCAARLAVSWSAARTGVQGPCVTRCLAAAVPMPRLATRAEPWHQLSSAPARPAHVPRLGLLASSRPTASTNAQVARHAASMSSTSPPSLSSSTSGFPAESFEQYVASFVDKGSGRKAVRLYQAMRDAGHMPSQELCARLVELASTASSGALLADAVAVFDDMRAADDYDSVAALRGRATDSPDAGGPLISTATAELLVQHCAVHANQLERALSIVQEMHEVAGYVPSRQVYNALLTNCVRNRQGRTAQSLVDEMTAAGVEMSHATVQLLVEAHLTSRDWESAHAAVLASEEQGLKFSTSAPWDAFLKAASRGRFTYGVYQVRKAMAERSVVPSAASYFAFLQTFLHRTRVAIGDGDRRGAAPSATALARQALQLLQEMREQRLRPGMRHYNVAVELFAADSDLASASTVVDMAIEEGLEPDTYTYHLLIKACTLADPPLFPEAEELLSRMRRRTGGSDEAPGPVNVLLRGCIRHGNMELALRIVEDMALRGESPTPGVYSQLVEFFVAERDFENALWLYSQMKTLRVPVRERVYKLLVYACLRDARWKLALDIGAEMRSHYQLPHAAEVFLDKVERGMELHGRNPGLL